VHSKQARGSLSYPRGSTGNYDNGQVRHGSSADFILASLARLLFTGMIIPSFLVLVNGEISQLIRNSALRAATNLYGFSHIDFVELR
jgi:hypothetical protein